MYIKFRNSRTGVEVRDVRNFDIRSADCGAEDGSTIHGAELVDRSLEAAGDFADAVVEYACGIMLGGGRKVDVIRFLKNDAPISVARSYSEFCPEASELGWFQSWAAAERVLDDICEALSAGKQFFDLTRYGKDGMVRT